MLECCFFFFFKPIRSGNEIQRLPQRLARHCHLSEHPFISCTDLSRLLLRSDFFFFFFLLGRGQRSPSKDPLAEEEKKKRHIYCVLQVFFFPFKDVMAFVWKCNCNPGDVYSEYLVTWEFINTLFIFSQWHFTFIHLAATSVHSSWPRKADITAAVEKMTWLKYETPQSSS